MESSQISRPLLSNLFITCEYQILSTLLVIFYDSIVCKWLMQFIVWKNASTIIGGAANSAQIIACGVEAVLHRPNNMTSGGFISDLWSWAHMSAPYMGHGEHGVK